MTATEAGDAKETSAATAGLPTQNKRLVRLITNLDETEPNPATRSAQKRLMVLPCEIAAGQERRRRKRREATQRRNDRRVHAECSIELPSA